MGFFFHGDLGRVWHTFRAHRNHTEITRYEGKHATWQDCYGVRCITVGGQKDSHSLTAPHGTGAGIGAPDPAVEAREEARIRRRPRGPLPPAPHILCFPPAPAQEALSASHREGAARAWGSYFRAIPAGGTRAGGAWRWRQRRRPSVCFYFIQQKVLFVEANRRWGLELEGTGKGKKKKPHPLPHSGLPRNYRVGVND